MSTRARVLSGQATQPRWRRRVTGIAVIAALVAGVSGVITVTGVARHFTAPPCPPSGGGLGESAAVVSHSALLAEALPAQPCAVDTSVSTSPTAALVVPLDSGTRLAVVFLGSGAGDDCHYLARVDVVETSSTVALAVYAGDDTRAGVHACSGLAIPRYTVVVLRHPLTGRQVLNAGGPLLHASALRRA